MKYEVRASERDTGWVTIAIFSDIEEAKAEFQNQLYEDKKENIKNLRTEIVNSDNEIIQYYEGEEY